MTFKGYLPIPPSLNGLFATDWKTKRRHVSKPYHIWLKRAAECIEAEDDPIEGGIHASYSYVFPDRRKRDLANFEKAVSDFLVTKNIILDDSQIDHLELKRITGTVPGVYIELREIS